MNVAIFTNNFPTTSQTFVLDHVKGLIDRGINTKVIAKYGDKSAWVNVDESVYDIRSITNYIDLPKNRLKRLFGIFSLFLHDFKHKRNTTLLSLNPIMFKSRALKFILPYEAKALAELEKIDILHCHFGPNGILGAYLKKLGLVEKLVVTFHGYDLSRELQKRGTKNPYANIFTEADLLLPVSDYWKKKLIDMGAPKARTKVHRMGIDTEGIKYQKRTPNDGALEIITVARFTEKKGIQYAIKSLDILRRKYPQINFKYNIVGDGILRPKIESIIAEKGLDDVVTLHGMLPHIEVLELLNSADVFLLPSVTATDGDMEGIPVALMEAMAAGLPVISTWHSGIPELIEHNESGLLSTERDAESLAEQIHYFAINQVQWVKFGEAGRNKVEKSFDNEVLNDELVSLYESIYNKA